jgi:hypothetical protein
MGLSCPAAIDISRGRQSVSGIVGSGRARCQYEEDKATMRVAGSHKSVARITETS